MVGPTKTLTRESQKGTKTIEACMGKKVSLVKALMMTEIWP
jgi:hypothetical protein